MNGTVMLDTENVFYGLGPTQRPDDDRTVQQVLFGRGGEGERQMSELKTILLALDRAIGWFEWHSGRVVSLVDSYGKRHDPSVDLLLRGLAAEHGSFARVGLPRGYTMAELNANPEKFEASAGDSAELVLFRRGDVRIVHHSVGAEKHAAEVALVADLRSRLTSHDGSAYFLGGEDHDALYPADHAQQEHRTVELWVLLPIKSTMWTRAHRLGPYRALNADRFVSLGEIMRSYDDGDVAVERDRSTYRRRITSTLNRAGREFTHPLSADQESALASLIGIHAGGLTRAVFGSKQWQDAIQEPWLLRAAERFLPELVRPAEFELLCGSGIGGERAAHLVRECGILRFREERPDVTRIALASYLARLSMALPYLDALSALAAVAPQFSAGSATVEQAGATHQSPGSG